MIRKQNFSPLPVPNTSRGGDGLFSSALCNGVTMEVVVVGRVENCEVTASKLMMVKTWKTID